MLRATKIFVIALGVVLSIAPLIHATTYTNDLNLSDFTSTVSEYATIIQAPFGDFPPLPALPHTTTVSDLVNGYRFYGNDDIQPLIVKFNEAVSQILVFPSIDHPGSSYDGYQYKILGSNDGVTYTPLFDATGVTGSGEPFTLGSFTGTAPTSVNNVIMSNCYVACVGYIANFTFGQSYQYYEFGVSTFAGPVNGDQELSGVGTSQSVPEPSSLALLGAGLLALFCLAGLRGSLRSDQP